MRRNIMILAAAVAGFVFARETVDFCDGWEFSRDQKQWRAVEVPHDWAIEGPFAPKGHAVTGKLPWKGVGYYRKSIVLERVPQGKRMFLDFDGVMCDGTVYINGQPCARQPYGYLGMKADITPYLFSGTNEVKVKADTTKLFSRWYPGAGMYRRVRKIETGDVYLDERDLFITASPAENGGNVWNVSIAGEVTSRRCSDSTVDVALAVKSPSGEVVAKSSASVSVGGQNKAAFSFALPVEDPKLWNVEPNAALYTVELSLSSKDGQVADDVSVKTGFRTFRFDADEGFYLNGSHVQLKGVCLHSDLGILGMAFNRSAMRRELLALMDMGVNAIRTSHNPPSPELLELCDELGLFVWDECFDKWNATCGRGDEPLEDFVEKKLDEFVRRDRNHPCIFVWSIGNEISPGKACPPGQEHWAGSPALGTSAERCARFRNVVRKLDPTRLVGIGSCFPSVAEKGDYAPLDITGWNYTQQYNMMRKHYPEKPLIYSESASALSDYAHYAFACPTNKTDFDVKAFSVDSYDRNAAPWSDIPDVEFERMERDRYVAGEFVWTGVDYLGEPTPYQSSPVNGFKVAPENLSRSSYFGIYDLLCLPKDRVFLYRSHWRKDAYTLHVVPSHWNFPEKEGKPVPVYVYSNADEAELYLNGVSLGRRRKNPEASCQTSYYDVITRYRFVWEDVKYAAGELKVIAYGKDGKVLGEQIVRTASNAARVVLAPESKKLPADSKEFVFVAVTIEDAAGVPVPRDGRRISFSVEGNGQIVSVGNANPRGHDSFKDTSSHPLYNGRAGLYIRRTGSGAVRLVASAEGLAVAEIKFE